MAFGVLTLFELLDRINIQQKGVREAELMIACVK